MPSDNEQRIISGNFSYIAPTNHIIALQAVSLAVTISYCTIEYVWPAVKRRFFTSSAIQDRLRLARPISLNKYEEELAYAGAVHPSEIKATFDDVGGLDHVISELIGNISTMLRDRDEDSHIQQSKLYQPPTGILLYGPPGCGKTLIAKALAAECGARFINVPLSLLLDKWVGETEKYIEALFSLARKIQPCIIFVDEIDCLTRRRTDSETAWNSTMKSQFLALWDGLLTDRKNHVVVLGATNRRQDIDEAFIRRMPLQIKVDLPSAQQRVSILKVLLSDVFLHPRFSFEKIACETQGFSGSDLKELCRRVVMAASLKDKHHLITDEDFEPVLEKLLSEQ